MLEVEEHTHIYSHFDGVTAVTAIHHPDFKRNGHKCCNVGLSRPPFTLRADRWRLLSELSP
jgi:hypothetical protein